MKAKAYFDKYEEDLVREARGIDTVLGVKDLFIEMSSELKDILKKRNASKDSALASGIVEFNQKWNAIACRFEKKYGSSPVAKNGFMAYWVYKLPGLKECILKGENR